MKKPAAGGFRILSEKSRFLQRRMAMKALLRLFSGRKILAPYFLPRAITMGASYADADSALRAIRSPDHWVGQWDKTGFRRELQARRLQREGFARSAAEVLALAKGAYLMAQLPIFDQPDLKRKIYERAARLYAWIAARLEPPAQRVEIPFGATSLPGYVRKSEGSPCIAIFGGIDGTKEEMHHFGQYFVVRGFSILTFDAPGIGEAWPRCKLTPPFCEIGRSVYQFLTRSQGYPPSKIAFLGFSLGGNLAAHAIASGLDVAAFGAVCPPYQPSSYFERLAGLFQKAARFVSGMDGDLSPLLNAVSLEGIASRLEVPLTAVCAGRDEVIPAAEGRRLFESARGSKRLLYYEKATHCAPENSSEMLLELCLWFRERMK